jgi:hypothetical protein
MHDEALLQNDPLVHLFQLLLYLEILISHFIQVTLALLLLAHRPHLVSLQVIRLLPQVFKFNCVSCLHYSKFLAHRRYLCFEFGEGTVVLRLRDFSVLADDIDDFEV